ncbi:hypothetical protein CPC16_003726, partial [Podila verticillata]
MPRYPENRNFSLYVTGFSGTTRFENDEDAKSAVESTESFVLDGRVLNVQFAKSPKKTKDKTTTNSRPTTNSLSAVQAQPVPETHHSVPETRHRVHEAHRVYTNEAYGSKQHRRRHWYREEASVSPEPEAPMPRRSGSVRTGSVQKEEISLSVDDQD